MAKPVPSPARDHIADFGAFVIASPSSYHAATEISERLRGAGFQLLTESAQWQVSPGGRYLVVRDGAVIAFAIPENAASTMGFTMLGSHTDSPGFKLKPHPDLPAEGFRQAAVEIYGGPYLDAWFDRELEFAGRLVTATGTVLTRTGPLLRLPHLAIHLDRAANEALVLDRQRHTQPIWGLACDDATGILGLLATKAVGGPIPATDILGYDVIAADTQPPQAFGADGELWASGRLDNLLSSHAALTALLDFVERPTTVPRTIPLLVAFDHEEVGSQTRSGAGGTFLPDVLGRVQRALGADAQARRRSLAASLFASCDVGHGVHPNYPEKHDPTNRPLLGGGPMLKFNANQRYATDAVSAGLVRQASVQAEVPLQEFVSRNEVACGSTTGPITAARLGVRTVDLGVPILSMHSARGVTAVVDPWCLRRLLVALLARSGHTAG